MCKHSAERTLFLSSKTKHIGNLTIGKRRFVNREKSDAQ